MNKILITIAVIVCILSILFAVYVVTTKAKINKFSDTYDAIVHKPVEFAVPFVQNAYRRKQVKVISDTTSPSTQFDDDTVVLRVDSQGRVSGMQYGVMAYSVDDE